MRSKTKTYLNARNILPRRLYEKVCMYHHGPVWIPEKKRKRCKTIGDAARNRRIVRRYRQGVSLKQISKEECLCQERVRQIVKRSRKKK